MPYRLRMWLAFMPALWKLIVQYLPGEAGFTLRQLYWGKRLKHMGKGVRIEAGVSFENPERISLDDHCLISKNATLVAGDAAPGRELIRRPNDRYTAGRGEISIGKNGFIGIGSWLCGIEAGIQIGDDCSVAANCTLLAYSHHYNSLRNPQNRAIVFGTTAPNERHVMLLGPITMGDNSGLALNCVLLPGVAIESHCMVGIGSVAFSSVIPENSLVAGNPARVVGKRFAE